MRIAYCTRALFPQHGYGGLERAGAELMGQLLAQGVDIDLLTQPLPKREPVRLSTNRGDLRVHTAEFGRLPLRSNGIVARLTNYRSFVETIGLRVEGLARAGLVDAVYAHGLCAWGVRRAGEWGVPLVVNPHGLEEFKTEARLKYLAYGPLRAWMRAAGEAAERVIATDSSMREEVARLLSLPRGKVVALPNGIDLASVAAHIDEQVQSALMASWPYLAGSSDGVRGISVGRLEQNKGFEHLLRALNAAKDALGSEWGWTIAGEGSMRSRLERLSADLGLQDHLVFAGRLTDSELHNLYEMSNLFAHPTLFEGSSLVTLEAMAHGLPVVASAVGGIPDKVTNGENGFLVKPGDVSSLAAWIGWLAAHPLERAAMGKRSHEAVRRFDWPRIARATKRLLGELVEERRYCREGEVQPRAH